LEHLDLLGEIKVKNLYALDVNSRFELSPGVKDLQKVKELTGKLKNLNNG
jgi:phosphoribosylanthranilate isomerase